MEENDLIDLLILALNQGVDEVTFDRDALETNRPEDWGAVELTGEGSADWADGTMVEQEMTADVWVCLSDRGSAVKRRVQKALREFSAKHQAGWRLVSRAYLYDLDKVLWRWQVSLFGPLAEEEDPLPFADPEEDPEESPEGDPEDEWPEADPEEGADAWDE